MSIAPRWRIAWIALLLLPLAACSAIKVRDASIEDSIAARRDDALTRGHLSAATRESLLVLGVDARDCEKAARECLEELGTSNALDDERRLSAMAELQLADAIAAEHAGKPVPADEIIDRYVEVARLSYAYLFFTRRTPGQRAFEDRQTQVRDFYNHATERFVGLIFERSKKRATPGSVAEVKLAHWRLALGTIGPSMPGGGRPAELVAASRLRFDGIRNTYQRDGFGAAFVAIAAPDTSKDTLRESRYLAATVVARFPGATLTDVMAAETAIVDVHDPYRDEAMRIGEIDVPLAANFTAPYALWLSREGFFRQAGRALLGHALVNEPRIYLLQPYDPNRRTIVMLHGLASSPEAWVNLANEVMGDDDLRRDYQIWQVFYPTNLPIALNQANIRRALEDAFARLDPGGTARASHDVTLIGHSMGGVIARLMIVDSGDVLWQSFFDNKLTSEQRQRLAILAPYLDLSPLPEVHRAIFLASPHRGAPMAAGWIGRLAAGIIRLPATILHSASDIADAIATEMPAQAAEFRSRKRNSVVNLSERDPYLRATSTLPIAPGIAYHSIIGRKDPKMALDLSSDGVVPYGSAHLDGAASELIVTSSHGVQNSPAAILEIRRILRAASESVAEATSAR